MKADFPSEAALLSAAAELDCEVAAIKAVAKVEAGPQGAFLESGAPVILFERHKFSKHTGGRYDGRRLADLPVKYNLISWPTWGGYGPVAVQHVKLAAAASLDRPAALMACSWGLYQLLGENWRACGYESLQHFVNAMYRSVDDHLHAFVEFIRSHPRLWRAIQARDWTAFARGYNGPKFAVHQYDARLDQAYRLA